MNKKLHKRGVNSGYVSLLEKAAATNGLNKTTNDQPKNLFRGLISGTAFTTLKGNRGTAIDSLWGKHIFCSLNNDDVELLEIAMRSSLCDMTEVVTGGENGSPYTLGDLGFYSENKLTGQTELLQGLERKYAVGKYFLSAKEWSEVDAQLGDIGHFSNALVRRAVRGDTFGALALRANAFLVAKTMLENGVDMLLENCEGEDLIGILQEQYGYVSGLLHGVLTHKDETQRHVFPPSETEALERDETYVLDTFNNMLVFVDVLLQKLDERIVLIHRDRQAKRRAEMRKETLPPFNLWNANLLDKAQKHIKKCTDIKSYIHERIDTYTKHNMAHVSMAELVHLQHALTVSESDESDSIVQRVSSKLSMSSLTDDRGALSSSKDSLYSLLGISELGGEGMQKGQETKALIETSSDGPLLGPLLGVLSKTALEQVAYR